MNALSRALSVVVQKQRTPATKREGKIKEAVVGIEPIFCHRRTLRMRSRTTGGNVGEVCNAYRAHAHVAEGASTSSRSSALFFSCPKFQQRVQTTVDEVSQAHASIRSPSANITYAYCSQKAHDFSRPGSPSRVVLPANTSILPTEKQQYLTATTRVRRKHTKRRKRRKLAAVPWPRQIQLL